MHQLSVMCYNIWFAKTEREKRLISLIEIIEYYNPDVICLQEVIPEISSLLINNLKKYEYVFPDEINDAYGCQIFSKHPIICFGEYAYEKTNMARKLHYIVLEYCGQNLVIATSHFESEFKKYNPIKISQYGQAHAILNKLYTKFGPVIFCCDTNISSDEEKYFLTDIDDTWLDTWSQNGKDTQTSYTYDTKLNVNLKNRNFQKEIRARIDRIIYRGRDILVTSDFKLVRSIGDRIEPSDHFGILVYFVVNSDKISI
jgi:tyrosyl-DNA phosphodiesterase 2